MRVSALHQALTGAEQSCLSITVACDTHDTCARTCWATGSLRDGSEPEWWFDRAYCPAYLDHLLHRLRLARVSAVVCSSLDTSRYLRALADRIDVPLVFDMHNVEVPLYRAVLDATPVDAGGGARITADFVDRVAAAEHAAIAAADELWVCSEDDRRLVHNTYRFAREPHVQVVPNVLPVGVRPPKARTPVRVAFTGRLDYEPNTRAALTLLRDVAPELAALGSPLSIVLAGADPHRLLTDARLPANVRILADPPSVDEVIRGSIMAAPLQEGGGSRFKILEAFGHGAAVVSTAKGVEGLDVQENIHYLRAESAAEFAAGIETLRRDDRLRCNLTNEAWRLLATRYSVGMLREQLARWRPHKLERVASS